MELKLIYNYILRKQKFLFNENLVNKIILQLCIEINCIARSIMNAYISENKREKKFKLKDKKSLWFVAIRCLGGEKEKRISNKSNDDKAFDE